jgi:hypothetical protein
MSGDKSEKQKTLAPKEEDRIDIPIPSKHEFFDNLKKAAKPESSPSRTKDKRSK